MDGRVVSRIGSETRDTGNASSLAQTQGSLHTQSHVHLCYYFG